MSDNYTVYMHTCPNGKKYIGLTVRKPEERWGNGKHYQNNDHFYKAINKYGWDNIKHEIIEKNISKKRACELEQALIKKYDTTNRTKGYNKSIGGEKSSLGFHHTEEAKEKIREASRGRKQSKESIEKSRLYRIKRVNIYDLSFNLLKTCESIAEAEKYTGVDNSNISSTCKGRYKQSNGYIFRYADEEQVFEHSNHRKPVNMYSLNGEFIKTWGTIKEAARALNIVDTHISDCCKGKYKKSGGYIWRYAE